MDGQVPSSVDTVVEVLGTFQSVVPGLYFEPLPAPCWLSASLFWSLPPLSPPPSPPLSPEQRESSGLASQ